MFTGTTGTVEQSIYMFHPDPFWLNCQTVGPLEHPVLRLVQLGFTSRVDTVSTHSVL